MKAIISIIAGMISFSLIAGMQINMLILLKVQPSHPTVYSIGIGYKLFVIFVGVLAIMSSVLYSRAGEFKLKIISKVGMLLGIISILLCFVPVYLILNV